MEDISLFSRWQIFYKPSIVLPRGSLATSPPPTLIVSMETLLLIVLLRRFMMSMSVTSPLMRDSTLVTSHLSPHPGTETKFVTCPSCSTANICDKIRTQSLGNTELMVYKRSWTFIFLFHLHLSTKVHSVK